MIDDSPPPAGYKSPEDSLKEIAPALRELAAGVRAVPSEIKGELGKQTLVADTAYKTGLKDGVVFGCLGMLALLFAAYFAGETIARIRGRDPNGLWTKK